MGRNWSSLQLLLQLLGPMLVLVGPVSSWPHEDDHVDKTIHLGYLLEDFSRAGAINVAIEHAQHDGLLRDYDFR